MSIVWIILAYFIGAIPSGYIIGRVFYGVNLKKVGSGNIGATNAYRELGAKAGAAVFICDFLKGFIAVHLGMPDPTIVLACAVFAIIGNDWSVFLHFKSGKGVACGVGAFTYICFPAVLAAFLVWLVLFKWKHIVSLGSILAAPVVPIVMLVVESRWNTWPSAPWQQSSSSGNTKTISEGFYEEKRSPFPGKRGNTFENCHDRSRRLGNRHDDRTGRPA